MNLLMQMICPLIVSVLRFKLIVIISFAVLLFTPAKDAFSQSTNTKEALYQPGKIIIGDDINYPPYSFLNEKGEPAGFNIDIARAVGEAMGLEVEIRLDSWDKTREALEKGQIDAISGMFYSAERAKIYGYSSRHSVSTGDIFTTKNTSLAKLQDLRGKQVVVQTGDIIAEYLQELDMEIELIEVSTVKKALSLLEEGTYDFAGLLKLPGLYSIYENELKNVRPAGLRFLPKDYCMVVDKENENLLYILNAGLHIIKASDQYHQIHDKWLGVYEERTMYDFLFQFRWILIIIAATFLFLIITAAILRYLITQKTKELQILNNDLLASNEEVKSQNEQLAQSQNELEARLDKINEQGEIIRFKQNFLANMSHEIRTPLTGVLGMIDIMGQTTMTSEQSEYISILKHSGVNLKEIIDQVLDYSKIEAGKLHLNKKDFRFKDLTLHAQDLFHSLINEKIIFESSVDPDIPSFINADKSRIMQIINNLISNAVKFTPEGRIQFKASRQREMDTEKQICIKIAITDTGHGISEEQQQILFKPFAQIHQSDSREHEGTGLGLSICKELVKLHGGEIGVSSQYGLGSTFWFTFMTEKTDAAPQKEEAPADQPDKTEENLTILLVEDKVVNQKVMSMLLSRFGHRIEIAENGAVAVKAYQPGKYDLILMDIQMPVMDGITATKLLRENFCNLPPIIGLSANAFEGDREKYMQMGLDEYLTKPLKKEDFLEALLRVQNIRIRGI